MALFPKQYLDALVSIEVDDKELSKKSIASAFLYGAKIPLKDPQGRQRYLTFLITNRHVFEDDKGNYREKVYLRFNVQGGAKHYLMNLLDKQGKPIWLKHKSNKVDLAAIQLRGAVFGLEQIKYFIFTDDRYVYYASQFEDIGIAPGDGVFMLGFPMGIRGKNKNCVIVRRGIISRVDDEILDDYYYFIDASAYPGNSGGPVILKPEALAISGTKSVSNSRLIGVVSKGLTYEDVAVSKQTGKPRITFEEQTGLVAVVPVDAISELVKPVVEKTIEGLKKGEKIKTDTEKRIKGVPTATSTTTTTKTTTASSLKK